MVALVVEATQRTPHRHNETLVVTPGQNVDRSGVAMWTYPSYYDGTIFQAGQPIRDRGLGLEINAFHYQILKG
jgi:hypothetical protein